MRNSFFTRFSLAIILHLGLSYQMFSQPTTWAQQGAHWIYKFGDDSNFSSSGIFEVRLTGDTIINGITCDVLSRHFMYQENWPLGGWVDYYDPNCYSYKNGDTVFITQDSIFAIMFVGNIQPSGWWESPNDYYAMCGADSIYIDSVEVVTINGVTMNKLIPEEFDWLDPEHPTVYFHHPIFERFGSTGYFLPLPACIICPSWGPLICYTDASGFFYSPDSSIVCPVGMPEIFDKYESFFKVLPNPSSDMVNIFIDNLILTEEITAELSDINGKHIRSIICLTNQTSVNISGLTAGVYYIKIKNRPQMKPVSFVKY